MADIKRKQAASNLVWIDLEMTGLDAQSDVIIQAALIVTDKNLEPLEELVVDVWQPAIELEKMTPFVRDMHTTTGLLQRVSESKTDLGKAERMLLQRVAGWCPLGAPICGNSIGQDKRFIDRYMPGLAGYLSYRVIDVSSLKLLAKLWYGEQAVFVKPEEGAHDALVDIRNSISELRHYRRLLFKDKEDLKA